MNTHQSDLASIARKLIPERFRPIGYLGQLTRERCDRRVRSGPFLGMRYIDNSVGSAYIPKLLGIYERELHRVIESACNAGFSLIVDIGAAEGYYAVGMATRNPGARVEAFEMDPTGLKALKEMAALNGVGDRISIRGKCEVSTLQSTLEHEPGRYLIICDVEGYEETLLDPCLVTTLGAASILVELHDFLIPGITDLLKERFSSTHRIEHIWQEPRDSSDFPFRSIGTALLPGAYLDWAVSEWRPERMAWLWMEPLAQVSGS